MAETLVENQVCPACSVDVRKGALFCYYCGGAIAPTKIIGTSTNGDQLTDEALSEKTADQETNLTESDKVQETSKLDTSLIEKTKKIDKPIAKPSDDPIQTPIEKPTGEPIEKLIEKPIAKPFEKPIEKPNVAAEPKLKSAAAMRRRAKIIQKKQVEEVVWEEHENAPNLWFMAVAFILILIAAGLFYLAIYIK